MLDPNVVHEKFRLAGVNWAKMDGVASKLEEMRKSIRAQIMNSFGEKSVNKAEMLAESDPAYIEHIEKMVDARTQANIARAEFDAIKAWVEITRSMESSRRAEMMMSR